MMEPNGKTENSPPIVALKEMRFQWQGSTTETLNIESLSVAMGERVFVKGNSGSGKTTLLNIIAGVIVPTKGDVKVLGEQLNLLPSWKRDAFRSQHVGIIFQIFNLIPYLSLIDNVTLPCSFSAERKTKAIERSGSLENEARRLLEHLDLDLENLAGKPVSRLSVGQQQRVAVARALMGGPELVIADEPTSALDADTREAFLELLFQEVEDNEATLIFVSHDASLERYFDRGLHLNDINQATGELV
ncbi:MAG: ABC transporter ATP-binding protein [Sneathiella sp.]|uniref:ABC transporter ATP-binding protein n=1 Tax=Sneathiella sp. TaxID=1964365 RepID=UPI0030019645